MTPQEMQIVDKAVDNLASLNQFESGFVRGLKDNIDARRRRPLTPNMADVLHRIDEKLFRLGVVHMPNVMTTISGKQIDFRAVSADDISIHDIAHGLSHICRFGGQAKSFYSVASHSMRVADLVPPAQRLAALLHDSTEAYLGDMVTPLKRLMPEYRRVESTLWRVIAEKYGVDEDLGADIKAADQQAFEEEAGAITCIRGMPHASRALATIIPEAVRMDFLQRFFEYGGRE